MTGKELHEAMEIGCIKNCKECKLNSNGICLIKAKEKWEQWAKEEHIVMGKLLNEEQGKV